MDREQLFERGRAFADQAHGPLARAPVHRVVGHRAVLLQAVQARADRRPLAVAERAAHDAQLTLASAQALDGAGLVEGLQQLVREAQPLELLFAEREQLVREPRERVFEHLLRATLVGPRHQALVGFFHHFPHHSGFPTRIARARCLPTTAGLRSGPVLPSLVAMNGPKSRVPAALALLAALLGLTFASYSTLDYAEHLDRGLHDIHCSVIPGMPATAQAEACRAAMYSPYSAIMKTSMWGGIPISLFAQGSFVFFAGFALYLLVAGPRASRAAAVFFAAVGVTPLLVSLVMFVISITKLGDVCRVCLGIYLSSTLLAVSALLGLRRGAAGPPGGSAPGRQPPGWVWAVVWLAALGATTLVPSLVYASAAPDERPYLTKCGEIKQPKEQHDALVHLATPKSVQAATLFEDPLCPTCKAFHERLVTEGVMDKLDVQLALFPLDSDCNWMLEEPLHPGACVVARAVLCGGAQTRQVLDWAYDQQEYLSRAGKAGKDTLRAAIKQRWGDQMLKCVDARSTQVRLNNNLHFAADNNIPVSTPQMYLGTRRVCDEDTDLGLMFTLNQLAPEVLK